VDHPGQRRGLVDLAPDGTVAGIELLNANEQLRASDRGQLVVADEARGSAVTVALTTRLTELAPQQCA